MKKTDEEDTMNEEVASVIQYNNEHVHVIDTDGTESCYRSRAWNAWIGGRSMSNYVTRYARRPHA